MLSYTLAVTAESRKDLFIHIIIYTCMTKNHELCIIAYYGLNILLLLLLLLKSFILMRKGVLKS